MKTPQSLMPNQTLIDDLVLANHILFDQGVVDAFGHVSVRHDKKPGRFLMASSVAPYRVSVNDILVHTLEGDLEVDESRKLYLERFIHSEIYRECTYVNSVVHSHSHDIIPFTVAKDTPLRALSHMAGFIGLHAPVFDVADVAGSETDLLIRNKELGAALAKYFVRSSIVLMRGHGCTVVAPSLKLAVYRAVYASHNARYQRESMMLGDAQFLSEGEAVNCMNTAENDVQRPWDLWKTLVERGKC